MTSQVIKNKHELYFRNKQYLWGKRAKLPKFLSAPVKQFHIDNHILYFTSVNDNDRSKAMVLTISIWRKYFNASTSNPISKTCRHQRYSRSIKEIFLLAEYHVDTKPYLLRITRLPMLWLI